MLETGAMFNNWCASHIAESGGCRCLSVHLSVHIVSKMRNGQSLLQPGRGEEEAAGKEDSRFSKVLPVQLLQLSVEVQPWFIAMTTYFLHKVSEDSQNT